MSLTPKRPTATSIAVLPDGSVAQKVASPAADVSVAGASVESSDFAYVSVAFVEHGDVAGTPGVYALSASGVSGTSL
jgi:hypothetical protein